MKFLLTSAGLTNPSICSALTGLVGKDPATTHLAFIPTAFNVQADDKHWVISHLQRIKNWGAGFVDIVDISALPRDLWQPRLEAADIIYVAGGNPYHLIDCMDRSGLAKLLPELLKTRVYVGNSAGSSIAGPSLALSSRKPYYPAGMSPDEPVPALGLVGFCIRSHLNSPRFPQAQETEIKKVVESLAWPAYAIDDQTAIKVVDGRAEVVTEGKYLYFDKHR